MNKYMIKIYRSSTLLQSEEDLLQFRILFYNCKIYYIITVCFVILHVIFFC